jgi:iron uptake system component EfeO
MPRNAHATARAVARPAIAGIAAAVAVVGLAACSSSGSTQSGKSGDTTGKPGGNPHAAAVTITAAKGCAADRNKFAAGGVTFNVSNKDATAVSEVELLNGERIVGEKENIPPGFGGKFAVNVTAGKYTLYCPGGTPERTTVTVTGKSASTGNDAVSTLLSQATAGYATYVKTQTTALLAAVKKFDAALHGTDLTAAQQAYMRARPFYEKIEPVAESFQIGKDNIDTDIDVRAGDVPAAQWRGFHRIEKALFQDKTLKGMGVYGDKLVADVTRLKSLSDNLKYQPTELANGAQELLDEVSSSKITGEEERYSHIDLLDFANNDEGAEQAFAQLQPALDKIDPTLSKTIADRFQALDTAVNKYRTDANPSGFRLYTQLSSSDKRTLAAAVKAVQEPLSNVASKVAAG